MKHRLSGPRGIRVVSKRAINISEQRRCTSASCTHVAINVPERGRQQIRSLFLPCFFSVSPVAVFPLGRVLLKPFFPLAVFS